jgi:hypothetical protein
MYVFFAYCKGGAGAEPPRCRRVCLGVVKCVPSVCLLRVGRVGFASRDKLLSAHPQFGRERTVTVFGRYGGAGAPNLIYGHACGSPDRLTGALHSKGFSGKNKKNGKEGGLRVFHGERVLFGESTRT